MAEHTLQGYQLHKSHNLEDYPKIQGYDFGKKFDFGKFLQSYATTGFQASHLAKAIEIIKTMKREKAVIFLSFTSNMISSGLREIIRYLVQHKFVDVLVTTAGGIEEDFIKCLKPFRLGSFTVPGRQLYEHGINRIGNVFVPNENYAYFEKEMNIVFEKVGNRQKEFGRALCSSELCEIMGEHIDNEESILYWAQKNGIPLFCPSPSDGSLGDLLFFNKQRNPDLQLDVSLDLQKMVKIVLDSQKTGVILLGAGTAKHYVLNAQIFRDGCDYAVYINTANEFDGSDSGASVDEAMTWGKVKTRALEVKVHADATIAFPLIMAGVLENYLKENSLQE